MRNVLKGLNRIEKICLILTLLFGMFAMTTVNYSDLKEVTGYSVKIWDSVFSGRFLQYFQDSGACYSLSIHLVFGIWNLPTYIIQLITKTSLIGSFACMIWNKLLLYGVAVLCTVVVDKIAVELGFSIKKRKLVFFLFMTSYFVLYAILIIGQYDIMCLFFMLLGFLALLKGNQKKFVLWFAIAITFKEFALVLFIPLLIYSNTKIRNIIKYTILSVIPLLLLHKDGLIFRYWRYQGAVPTGLESRILKDQLFADGQMFSMGPYLISPYVLLFVLLCIFCYCTKRKNDKEMMLYIAAIATALFSLVLYVNPYWPILMIPFVLLMIVNKSSNLNISVFLETIGTGAMVVMFMLVGYYWCTDNLTKTNTLLSAIFGERLVYKIGHNSQTLRLLNFTGTSFFSSAIRITLSSIAIACFIAIFVMSYPRKGAENSDDTVLKSYKIIRILGYLLICLIPAIELMIFL